MKPASSMTSSFHVAAQTWRIGRQDSIGKAARKNKDGVKTAAHKRPQPGQILKIMSLK
jgi:hypothetical protein